MAKLVVGFVQAIDVTENISNALLSCLQKIINLVLVLVAVSDPGYEVVLTEEFALFHVQPAGDH